MLPKFFIGIDISKLTLDIALLFNGEVLEQIKIANTEADIKALLKRFRTDYKCTPGNSFYCAESMGIYSTFLLNVCLQKKLVICQESPLQIKKSLGIQRGKNDALDSIRIASYAAKNYPILRPWQPPRPVIEKLKSLPSLRKRIIKTKLILIGSKKTESYYLPTSQLKEADKYTNGSVKALAESIELIEKEMEEIQKDVDEIEKDGPEDEKRDTQNKETLDKIESRLVSLLGQLEKMKDGMK